jgi:hypothetical protein
MHGVPPPGAGGVIGDYNQSFIKEFETPGVLSLFLGYVMGLSLIFANPFAPSLKVHKQSRHIISLDASPTILSMYSSSIQTAESHCLKGFTVFCNFFGLSFAGDDEANQEAIIISWLAALALGEHRRPASPASTQPYRPPYQNGSTAVGSTYIVPQSYVRTTPFRTMGRMHSIRSNAISRRTAAIFGRVSKLGRVYHFQSSFVDCDIL